MSILNARMAGGIAVVLSGFVLTLPAFAQNANQEVMKQCGDKWQAAKTANTTGKQTWPEFLTKCRAESAQKPAATPAAATAPATGAKPAAAAAPASAPATGAKPAAAAAPAAATPAAAKPAAAVPATAAKPAVAAPAAAQPSATRPAAPAAAPAPANAVFPGKIDPKYATGKPGQQRQKTCLDQYNANKATNGNGGLNWIQKGGGYYSECNKRLGGGAST